jgi:pimeloyl-ACP methyl ester carboxylesterase/predicted lactoylglutathione lyase
VVVQAEITGYWTLDEGDSGIALDSSGNGADGIISNASSFAGFEGTAVNFNGSSSMIALSASAFATIDQEITLAMWVQGEADQPRNDTIFYAKNAAGERVLNINLPWGDSTIIWDAGSRDGSYDSMSQTADAAYFKAEWSHWVFIKNASTGEMSIYLNGDLFHSASGMTNGMNGITTATLGAQIDHLYYSGAIDEVVLYDEALTAEKVGVLYDSYFSDVIGFTTNMSLDTALMAGSNTNTDARFQVYIPRSVDTVKAAFYISQHGQGTITHPVLQQFAEDEKVALIGFYGTPVQRGVTDVSVIDEHIATLAAMCGHTELPDVPIMTFGHSNGTGFSASWPRDRPDRVICWTAFHPGFSEYLQWENTEQVPALVLSGEVDSYFTTHRQDLAVQSMRSTRDAAMGMMVEGGLAHGMPDADATWTFVVEFCKAAMRIRLNEDGSLNPVNIETGWLGEIYDVDTGGKQLLDIASYAAFTNGPSTASWFPDETFAKQWRVYGSVPSTDYLKWWEYSHNLTGPLALAQSVATDENMAKAIALTGFDPEGDVLSALMVSGPDHGTVSLSNNVATYQPMPNYNGSDRFTFQMTDGVSSSLVATVSITVGLGNAALFGQDNFDGDTLYESRIITGANNSDNVLWQIVNRETVATDEVIDTSVEAGGVVARNTGDTLGFLGTNKTDNVFGMYRAGATRTLVYTFDVSGAEDLMLQMDWACSGDIADKNTSVFCSIDGGATQTVFDVASSGDNWNETMDNGTVLDRNRSASVTTNGVASPHLTDEFQTYTMSVAGTGSNLTVLIVMDNTVGGFGGFGLDNLKLYGTIPTVNGFEGWMSGYSLSGTNATESANPDGDRYTNYEEYIAGLNPNISDVFLIHGLTDGNRLEWNAASGRVYNVYWASNLVDGFALIKSNVVTGMYMDSDAGSKPQGFYKITVELE